MADKITTLHPKDDKNTNVYPNVKSENIIDKDTTSFTEGCVPDSKLVQKSLDSLADNTEAKIENLQSTVNKNTKAIEAETTARTTADEEIQKEIQDDVSTLTASINKNTEKIQILKTNLEAAINDQGEKIAEHDNQISSIQEDISTIDNSLLSTNSRVNDLENDTVDLTTDQEVNGVKTFKSPIKTNEIDNESGNALLRYKETEAKNVVGGVNYDLTLMGKSDRPKYSKDGSDFEGEELALNKDVSSILEKILPFASSIANCPVVVIGQKMTKEEALSVYEIYKKCAEEKRYLIEIQLTFDDDLNITNAYIICMIPTLNYTFTGINANNNFFIYIGTGLSEQPYINNIFIIHKDSDENLVFEIGYDWASMWIQNEQEYFEEHL